MVHAICTLIWGHFPAQVKENMEELGAVIVYPLNLTSSAQNEVKESAESKQLNLV
jgi:hypothetical protein